MSSHGSPTLVLELRSLQGQRLVALTFMALAGLAPLLLFPTSAYPIFVVLLAILGPSVLAAGFRRAGWLGGARSVTRAIWRGDGTWQLIDAAGRKVEARLSPASRMSPVAVWLRWSVEPSVAAVGRFCVSGGRARTVLLLPRDLPDPDFRRLLVRLRLDRSECAAPSPAQANS